mgnify:FL=1
MKKLSIKLIIFILVVSIIFSFIQIFFVKSEVQATGLSSSYTQYIKSGISAFPESYQVKLAYLKYLHPNWNFKAYYTGIDWNELTSSSTENRCLVNTAYKSSTVDPKVLCTCGRSGDPGYYCSSAKMVNYYLDPRNFMGEAMVFQFLELSNGDGVTRDVVASATNGTYLAQYVDDIMSAASEAGINPLHIVATIFQELGRTGTPKAISGTVPGYYGLYNFYNYGATDGNGAVERGLEMAKSLRWTTPRYALIDGAKKVLKNGYISAGQTTKYFYKFDVVGNEILTESMGQRTYPISQFYTHQYMTNLRDPAGQAGSLYDIYLDSGILDEHLTFLVPVYNNMPATPVPVPTSLTASQSSLYYINSMKEWGISFRSSPGGTQIGSLYKNTVVELLSNQGTWSKVRIVSATTYNASAKAWNYKYQEGYVATEYLLSVNSTLPDYRGQVDMGAGSNPSPDVDTADFKVDGADIIMTPATSVKNIKEKYAGAIIKKVDGTDISNSNDFIGTGMSITIDNKTYIAVKLGDVNGDGSITPSDYVKIKNNIMGVTSLTGASQKSADVNKDGTISPADYVKIKNYIMNISKITI